MMTPLTVRLAARCAADGEFQLSARYWTGSLRLDLDGTVIDLQLEDGIVTAARGSPASGHPGAGHIGLRGPAEVWSKILAPVPPPFFNDVLPALAFGLERDGEVETFWQYFPAVRRTIDLLREEVVL
jgi:hypothetical protein